MSAIWCGFFSTCSANNPRIDIPSGNDMLVLLNCINNSRLSSGFIISMPANSRSGFAAALVRRVKKCPAKRSMVSSLYNAVQYSRSISILFSSSQTHRVMSCWACSRGSYSGLRINFNPLASKFPRLRF